MALNNGLHYDLTDFKQADPFYHFCSGEGNIVPRVFLFSAAVLEWRRQFGDRVLWLRPHQGTSAYPVSR